MGIRAAFWPAPCLILSVLGLLSVRLMPDRAHAQCRLQGGTLLGTQVHYNRGFCEQHVATYLLDPKKEMTLAGRD